MQGGDDEVWEHEACVHEAWESEALAPDGQKHEVVELGVHGHERKDVWRV